MRLKSRLSALLPSVMLLAWLSVTLAAEPVNEFLGDPCPTIKPTLALDARPWVDVSGKHAVVATMTGLETSKVKLISADGQDKSISLDRLSKADAAYARLIGCERVNTKANVSIGRVTKVTDGDTIELRTIDDKTIKVRLEGIDAPETGQAFGSNAKLLLSELIFGKEVRAEIVDADKYGRQLAHIYVNDRWVNRAMVRAGLAWHYTKYSSDEDLSQAESLARLAGIGIWSEKSPTPPWDYRSGTIVLASPSKSTEPTYEVGAAERIVYTTKTGTKYHAAGCKHLSKSMIAIPLTKAQSTLSPCSHCRP